MLSFAAAAAVAKAEAIRTRPTTATRRLSNRRTSLRWSTSKNWRPWRSLQRRERERGFDAKIQKSKELFSWDSEKPKVCTENTSLRGGITVLRLTSCWFCLDSCVELATALLVWSNPNQLNRGWAVQWYCPLSWWGWVLTDLYFIDQHSWKWNDQVWWINRSIDGVGAGPSLLQGEVFIRIKMAIHFMFNV